MMHSVHRNILALVAIILIAALFNPTPGRADPSKYPQYALQQAPTAEFIKLEELVVLIVQKKRPLIIDVRTREEYEEIHILGSTSIPLSEISRRLEEIPKEKLAVLYWACPRHLASLAYGILHRKGYRNAKVLYEGLPGWIEKRYPVEGAKVR